MKKIILSCLLIQAGILSASNETDSLVQIRYAKVGTEVGFGYRLHKESHGFDLSAAYTPILGSNWINAKALYLNYPFYEKDRFFYFGAGLSMVLFDSFPRGWHRAPYLPLAIGYEFSTEKSTKTFLQFDLNFPLTTYPSVILPTLTFGFGF